LIYKKDLEKTILILFSFCSFEIRFDLKNGYKLGFA